MSAWTAAISNPEYIYTGGVNGKHEASVPIFGFGLEGDFDTVSAMTAYIKTDIVSKYGLETSNATNSLQTNSTFVFKRDSAFWFRGYVLGKSWFREHPVGNLMEVQVWGKDGILTQSLCPGTNGEAYWTLQTDSVAVTNTTFRLTENYGSFEGATLWPDPFTIVGAKCWLSDASSNNDPLEVNIGVGTYAISAVDTVAKTFTTNDQVDFEMIADEQILIDGSTGNDGYYTIASATWTGAVTNIVVDEVIPNAVADGSIVNKNIMLSATSKGFNPRGWVKIENEFVAYDGYDNASVDGHYRLRNVYRGELNTAAAIHLATTTVHEKIAKQLAPGPMRVERFIADWKLMRIEKEVQSVPKLGCFVLTGPVTSLTYRVSCLYYDEDFSLGGSVRISVNDIVEKMLTGQVGYGGAGFKTWSITAVDQGNQKFHIAENTPSTFVVGEYVCVYNSTGNDERHTVVSSEWIAGVTKIEVADAIPSAVADGKISMDMNLDSSTNAIMVNRYDYDPEDKPGNAYDAIMDLLSGLSIEDEIKFYYKHNDDKFRLRVISNDASTFTIPHIERIEKGLSLDDVYSAVQVGWEGDQENNVIMNMYHQAATGAGASPDRWQANYGNGSWTDLSSPVSTSVAAGNYGLDHCIDGVPQTSLAAIFVHDPAASFTFADFYFGSGTTPPIIPIKKIVMSINSYRTTDGKNYKNVSGTYIVRFQGATDYNTGTHAGTFKDLGFEMEGEPNRYGKWIEGKAETFAVDKVNCVRVIWDYMAGPVGGSDNFPLGATDPGGHDSYCAVIHDIKIIGVKSYVLVQLTDDITLRSNPLFIYAPDTFEKLRGSIKATLATAGCQRVLPYDIGVGTYRSAISAARTLLLTKLQQYESRHYSYTGIIPQKPELGLTVEVDETGNGVTDYTGVVRSYGVQHTGLSPIQTQATVMDYNASVIV